MLYVGLENEPPEKNVIQMQTFRWDVKQLILISAAVRIGFVGDLPVQTRLWRVFLLLLLSSKLIVRVHFGSESSFRPFRNAGYAGLLRGFRSVYELPFASV